LSRRSEKKSSITAVADTTQPFCGKADKKGAVKLRSTDPCLLNAAAAAGSCSAGSAAETPTDPSLSEIDDGATASAFVEVPPFLQAASAEHPIAGGVSRLFTPSGDEAARAAMIGGRWSFQEEGLWFSRDEVMKGRESCEPLRGEFEIEMVEAQLDDGTEIMVVSQGKTNFFVLAAFGVMFREIKQPVLVRDADASADAIYLNNAIYIPRPKKGTRESAEIKEGMRVGGGTLFESAFSAASSPTYIVATSHVRPTATRPPDGIEIRRRDDRYHTVLLFRGEDYPLAGWLSDPTEHQGGWRYVRSESQPSLAIRFRKSGGRWEIEPWEKESGRFPAGPEKPVFVRGAKGEALLVLAGKEDGSALICEGPKGHVALRAARAGYKEASLCRVARSLLPLRRFDDPVATWRSLLPKDDRLELSRAAPAKIEIDVANIWQDAWVERDRLPPRQLPYLQYELTRDGHTLLFRVPDLHEPSAAENFRGVGEEHFEQLRRALARVPREMWLAARTVTVTPASGRPGDASFSGQGGFKRGGEIFFAMGERPFFLPIEQVVLHEFGHSFTVGWPREQEKRLEAIVASAMREKGAPRPQLRLGYDWKEALADGFENFEHAGPAMQQLILNVFLNPAWQGVPDDAALRKPRRKVTRSAS
jgi:hypothetical protein